jgi:hypothetical protein
MGQQQILLIILGVIVVAVAIAVGLQQFVIGSETANREAIVNDISGIVGDAQAYYSRPLPMGGGNGSFTGYTTPARLNETSNATYQIEGNGNMLVIEGTSVVHNKVIVTLTLIKSDSGWDYTWMWAHEGL